MCCGDSVGRHLSRECLLNIAYRYCCVVMLNRKLLVTLHVCPPISFYLSARVYAKQHRNSEIGRSPNNPKCEDWRDGARSGLSGLLCRWPSITE